MHVYNNFVKVFLCKSIHRLQNEKKLTKLNMSAILRMEPRSYADISSGKYCLSAPSLLFLLAYLDDSEVLKLIHDFREETLESAQDWVV